jgi:hypothetical protein
MFLYFHILYKNTMDIKPNENLYNNMYVYLEPKGGFNDILSVIQESYEYCKQHNRILLVNGMKTVYKINFSEYFNICEDKNIIFDIDKIKNICITPSYKIYPNEFQDKMEEIFNENILFTYISNSNYYYEDIQLILPKDHITENIIIHSACCGNGGRNVIGYILFKELVFHKNVIDICKERYDTLNKPYLCIYIRNTDYKCDYINFFMEHENEIRSFKEIYIATDDKKSIDFYREKGLQVKNFTTFPDTNYYNLHYSNIDPHTKFIDMICDIFISGFSHTLMSNSSGGFIKLVRSINISIVNFELYNL